VIRCRHGSVFHIDRHVCIAYTPLLQFVVACYLLDFNSISRIDCNKLYNITNHDVVDLLYTFDCCLVEFLSYVVQQIVMSGVGVYCYVIVHGLFDAWTVTRHALGTAAATWHL